VKFAVASGGFDRALERGDLTQLEFVDLCARDLRSDGVVLDVRHFPRLDDDYLAQVKKMTTDLGLCVAAIADEQLFVSAEEAIRRTLTIATATGAPLVAAPLGSETALAWIEQLERIGTAARLAKALNVTLALRNAPATFAASVHDCKRVTKEADSAWLRYGPDPAAFEAADDPLALASKSVLAWRQTTAQADTTGWESFRGFITLDRTDGNATAEELREAILRWKTARSRIPGENLGARPPE
jgi:sugar phosphate isomerase/epimerase